MNKPRCEHEGAWHHVTNRGVDQCLVFRTEHDKQMFVAYMVAAAKRYGIEIHSFVLMDNHFHIQIRTPSPLMFRMMQHLKSRYTKWFNRQHNRTGPLFGGRYESEPIETEAHLDEVSRYVHNNPVKAGMVNHPEEYPWSSMPAYFGHIKPPGWLHTSFFLRRFRGAKRFVRFTHKSPRRNQGWDPTTPRESRCSPKFLASLEPSPAPAGTTVADMPFLVPRMEPSNAGATKQPAPSYS